VVLVEGGIVVVVERVLERGVVVLERGVVVVERGVVEMEVEGMVVGKVVLELPGGGMVEGILVEVEKAVK
jgi:hypothetical protein